MFSMHLFSTDLIKNSVVGVSYIFDAEKGVLPFLDKSAHLKGKV